MSICHLSVHPFVLICLIVQINPFYEFKKVEIWRAVEPHNKAGDQHNPRASIHPCYLLEGVIHPCNLLLGAVFSLSKIHAYAVIHPNNKTNQEEQNKLLHYFGGVIRVPPIPCSNFHLLHVVRALHGIGPK